MSTNENKNQQAGLGIKVIAILLVAHAFEHIYANGLPALFPLIREEFGLSYTQIAFLATARELVRGFMQLPAGYLSDRTGSSNLFIYGFLGVSAATLLTGLSPVYYLIVLFQIISGISSSSFHPCTYALIVDHTPAERMGKVISVHTLGGSMGNAVVFMLSGLFAMYLGWRFTLVIWALPGFLISYVFLKIFQTAALNKPACTGKDGAKPPAGPQPGGESRTKGVIVFTIISLLLGMSSRGLPIFLPLYFTEVYSRSIAVSGFLASLYFVAGFPGLLLGGYLTDKYNKLLIITCTTGVVSLLLFILARADMALYPLMGLIFVIGLIKTMSFPAMNSLAGLIAAEKKRGVMFGLIFGGGFLGATIGTLIYGFLADLYGLQGGLLLFGFVSLATSLLSLGYKLTNDRPASTGTNHRAA